VTSLRRFDIEEPKLSLGSGRGVGIEECGCVPRKGIVELEQGAVPESGYVCRTALGLDFHPSHTSSGLESSRRAHPFTYESRLVIFLRAAKGSPVDHSQSRKAAICA